VFRCRGCGFSHKIDVAEKGQSKYYDNPLMSVSAGGGGAGDPNSSSSALNAGRLSRSKLRVSHNRVAVRPLVGVVPAPVSAQLPRRAIASVRRGNDPVLTRPDSEYGIE
jgi:hypothetical protein